MCARAAMHLQLVLGANRALLREQPCSELGGIGLDLAQERVKRRSHVSRAVPVAEVYLVQRTQPDTLGRARNQRKFDDKAVSTQGFTLDESSMTILLT